MGGGLGMILSGLRGNYSWLLIMLASLAIGGLTQAYIRSTFRKWSQVQATCGLTGAQVAETILGRNGISARVQGSAPGLQSVGVIRATGRGLSDHFDPRKGIVALSEDVYDESSVASTAVAAHEVGHAIQTARGYAWSRVRTALVPAVNFGSQLAWILILVGLVLRFFQLYYLGIAFFGLSVLFQVVTLPVEINASARALTQLKETRLLSTGELSGARQVLTAAALTYVAAALVSVMYLLYYLGLGNRRN